MDVIINEHRPDLLAAPAPTHVPFVQAGEDITSRLAALDPEKVTAGKNIESSPGKSRVIATVSGVLRVIDGVALIDPAVEVAQVDCDSGAVTTEQGLVVHGDVLDRAQVQAGGSIWIAGMIDAASIVAAADISVAGGIMQRGKGRCVAGGSISARFLAGADVTARGDVIAQNEVSNSTVTCFGQLLVERGSIVASNVSATSGVRCGSIGCPASTRTVIAVGIDAHLEQLAKAQLPGIEDRRRRASRIRVVIEPLLRHQKHLTADGRDKATELLFEANELEVQTVAMLGELQALFDQVCERADSAQIIVTGTIHPGAILRFPGMECAIDAPIQGPAKILTRRRNGQREVAVIDALARCTRVLEHTPLHDATMAEIRRVLLGD